MDLDIEPVTPHVDWAGNWVGDFHKRIANLTARKAEIEASKRSPVFHPGDPGMDSNHELDRILKPHNLLILQSH
jgi:hypothetical protein